MTQEIHTSMAAVMSAGTLELTAGLLGSPTGLSVSSGSQTDGNLHGRPYIVYVALVKEGSYAPACFQRLKHLGLTEPWRKLLHKEETMGEVQVKTRRFKFMPTRIDQNID